MNREIRKSKRCIKPVFKLDEEKIEIDDESEIKGKEEDTTPPVRKKRNGTGATKSKKAEKEAMTNIFKANKERGAPKMQKVAQEGNKTGIKKKRKPDVKTGEGSPAAPYKRGKKKAETTPALMQIQEEDDVVLPSLNKRKREPKSTSKEKEGKQDEEEDVNPIMSKKGGRDTSIKEGSGKSKVGRGMKSSVKTDAKEEISSPLRRKKKKKK
ncbi:hypothetical protein E2C01_057069 [Portunus trituberculatus]|uniref:Uncharacterized protein n=1 Tax=Portunus trituberculatus TaxID=210409 RepID=A0A5B7H0T9_PORTR|nr:hypothetical protein [Portunus trituberculatus]